ncbi:hypothetical protein CPB83DRAFT_885742 [Crepidotus variabilis]|uniref:Uncharacterized protein n=1 Tax=Crepidotus variabilis TaxID=179855 RepID=A0A9P6E9W0_9AGAR|nr:hypothetical protein CPB83DRAFT_885742 [Crepidotus variabilis]
MDSDCLLPVFPVEIFSNVIESLHNDHALDTLKSCSVVNGWFQTLCQPLLFSTVKIGEAHARSRGVQELGFYSKPIKAQQFADTLRRSPSIGVFVRSLKYTVTPADFGIPHLNEALKQLEKIESLSVGYSYRRDLGQWNPEDYERLSMDWQTCPLLPGFLHLFNKPTLVHFRFGDIIHNFPIEHLVHCSNLKALSLDVDMTSSQVQSTLFCDPIRLEELTCSTGGRGGALQVMRTCQSNGTSVFDLTNLKLLSTPLLRDQWFDDPFIIQYAFKHAKNLEHLQLSVTSMTSCENLYGDILTPKALQAVKVLDVLLLHATISVIDPYLGLCNELKKMSGKNNVHELKIGVTLQALSGAMESAFSDLEEVVSGTGWPCLKKVRLAIQIPQRGLAESEHKALLQTLRTTRFPRLASSQTIAFECVSHIGRLL